MFFWNSLAFSMIQQMLAIWPLVPLPSLIQLEHLEVHGSYIAEAWLGEFWALQKVILKMTFSSPVATAEFSKFVGILSAALSQHHLSWFEIPQVEFWKRSVFIPILKKGNTKECSNYCTIAVISHTNKVMLFSPSEASAIREWWTSRCSSWF